MITISDRASQFKIGVALALAAGVALLVITGFTEIVAVAVITALAFLFGGGFSAYYANSQRLSRELAVKRAEAEMTNKGVEALNAVMLGATVPYDLELLLNQVLDALLAVTGLEVASVCLFDEEDQSPRVRSFRETVEGLYEQVLAGELGERIARRVVASGAPLFIEDLAREGWQVDYEVENPPLRTVVSLTILGRGKTIGVLNLARRDRRKEPEKLSPLLQAFCSSIGTVIENSRQYEVLDKMNERLLASTLEMSEACGLAQNRVAELETVISSIPHGILLCDKDGHLTMANKAAEKLLGGPVPLGAPLDVQVQTLHLHKPSGETYTAEEMPPASSALKGASLPPVDVVVRRPGEEPRTLQVNTAPVLGADGSVVGAVGVFADVTGSREVERLRDEFVYVASHELKNPLTSMKGWAQLLLKKARHTPERESEVQGLVALNGQIERLAKLVSKLVDFTRIRAGFFELNPEPTDLLSVVGTVISLFQVTTSKHQIRLETSLDKLIGNWDRDRIEQVLANLIDNAIKYSPEGGEVRVKLAFAEDIVMSHGARWEEPANCPVCEGWAVVSIEDQGIGVPRDSMDTLFHRFGRAENVRKGRVEGLGLGLYISQQIVAGHGGKIWVESEEGGGSTFAFALPLSLPETKGNV